MFVFVFVFVLVFVFVFVFATFLKSENNLAHKQNIRLFVTFVVYEYLFLTINAQLFTLARE